MGAADGGLIVKRLSQDAVFRIEVSLSSRKSSAIVMRTTARLYSLQGTAGGGGASGERVGGVSGRVTDCPRSRICVAGELQQVAAHPGSTSAMNSTN